MTQSSQNLLPTADVQESIDQYIVVDALPANAPLRAYLGRDRNTGDEAVIVVLTSPHGNDADLQKAFRRATRIALQTSERLAHPGVVRVLGRGFSHGQPYVAQEHAAGLTLAECMESGIEFHAAKLVDIFAQVADTLEHAHCKDVVHGDVQPQHIILTRTGRVRIRNFGFDPVLRFWPQAADQAHVRAPELCDTQNGPNVASDIYALGATLYSVLTGSPALRASAATTTPHVATMPPSAFNPDVTPALDAVVLQAMHPDPSQRFRSMRVLAEALRAAMPSGAPTASAPMPPDEPVVGTTSGGSTTRRTRTRTRRVAPGVVAATAAVLAIAGFVLWPAAPETAPAPTPVHAPVAAPSPAPTEPIAMNVPFDEAEQATGEPAWQSASGPAGEQPAGTEAAASAEANAEADAGRATGAAPAKPAAVGRVSLQIRPWGEVRVNGESRGASPPLKVIELPEGTHRVEIRNADFAPHVTSVTIRKGTAVVIRHRFP